MDHHIDNHFGIDQTHFDNALKNIQLGIPYDNNLQQYINYKNTNQRCY